MRKLSHLFPRNKSSVLVQNTFGFYVITNLVQHSSQLDKPLIIFMSKCYRKKSRIIDELMDILFWLIHSYSANYSSTNDWTKKNTKCLIQDANGRMCLNENIKSIKLWDEIMS